jgi:cytochrome P450
MCIGNHLALLEMTLMAEKIYSNFDIENKSEKPMELITPMTLGTKAPYLVIIKKVPL